MENILELIKTKKEKILKKDLKGYENNLEVAKAVLFYKSDFLNFFDSSIHKNKEIIEIILDSPTAYRSLELLDFSVFSEDENFINKMILVHRHLIPNDLIKNNKNLIRSALIKAVNIPEINDELKKDRELIDFVLSQKGMKYNIELFDKNAISQYIIEKRMVDLYEYIQDSQITLEFLQSIPKISDTLLEKYSNILVKNPDWLVDLINNRKICSIYHNWITEELMGKIEISIQVQTNFKSSSKLDQDIFLKYADKLMISMYEIKNIFPPSYKKNKELIIYFCNKNKYDIQSYNFHIDKKLLNDVDFLKRSNLELSTLYDFKAGIYLDERFILEKINSATSREIAQVFQQSISMDCFLKIKDKNKLPYSDCGYKIIYPNEIKDKDTFINCFKNYNEKVYVPASCIAPENLNDDEYTYTLLKISNLSSTHLNLKLNESFINNSNYIYELIKRSGVDVFDFDRNLKKYEKDPLAILAYIQYLRENKELFNSSLFYRLDKVLDNKQVFKELVDLESSRFGNELLNVYRFRHFNDKEISLALLNKKVIARNQDIHPELLNDPAIIKAFFLQSNNNENIPDIIKNDEEVQQSLIRRDRIKEIGLDIVLKNRNLIVNNIGFLLPYANEIAKEYPGDKEIIGLLIKHTNYFTTSEKEILIEVSKLQDISLNIATDLLQDEDFIRTVFSIEVMNRLDFEQKWVQELIKEKLLDNPYLIEDIELKNKDTGFLINHIKDNIENFENKILFSFIIDNLNGGLPNSALNNHFCFLDDTYMLKVLNITEFEASMKTMKFIENLDKDDYSEIIDCANERRNEWISKIEERSLQESFGISAPKNGNPIFSKL